MTVVNDISDGRILKRSKRYNTIKLVAGLGETFLGWLYLLIIVLGGFTATVERWAYSITSNPYLALLVLAAVIGIVELILMIPLSLYIDYILEHKYELSSLTLKSYWWEKSKEVFVAVVIGAPVLIVFYYFLTTVVHWWIPVGIFAFFFTVLLGRLAPVLIFPLFYKFVPVENEELEALVRNRCESVGMKVQGVFQFDLSKTTRKANAAFTGIGKSKRILLADNLVDNFSPNEIDAVLAHELGHFKGKHLWKMIVLGTLFTFLGLYVVSMVYSGWSARLGYESMGNLAPLPLLILLLGVYGFVTHPVQNSVSRLYERAADSFSKEMLGGNAAPLVEALERLAELNLADRDPHPVVEFLFHSHPSIEHRIGYLQT
ncbi:MAG: M48 family metallopeptidase [Candidatus Neomarinimicrobiota bacterium]